MEYNYSQIQKEYSDLANKVEAELRRRARKILKENPHLHEFVKGFGIWDFTDTNGNSPVDFEKAYTSVAEIIREWDDVFYMTVKKVRFTTDGPEITNW